MQIKAAFELPEEFGYELEALLVEVSDWFYVRACLVHPFSSGDPRVRPRVGWRLNSRFLLPTLTSIADAPGRTDELFTTMAARAEAIMDDYPSMVDVIAFNDVQAGFVEIGSSSNSKLALGLAVATINNGYDGWLGVASGEWKNPDGEMRIHVSPWHNNLRPDHELPPMVAVGGRKFEAMERLCKHLGLNRIENIADIPEHPNSDLYEQLGIDRHQAAA